MLLDGRMTGLVMLQRGIGYADNRAAAAILRSRHSSPMQQWASVGFSAAFTLQNAHARR
jgi:hypothetical protein